jgi:hypothetical protein
VPPEGGKEGGGEGGKEGGGEGGLQQGWGARGREGGSGSIEKTRGWRENGVATGKGRRSGRREGTYRVRRRRVSWYREDVGEVTREGWALPVSQ